MNIHFCPPMNASCKTLMSLCVSNRAVLTHKFDAMSADANKHVPQIAQHIYPKRRVALLKSSGRKKMMREWNGKHH
jgi:hypothetical protein